MSQSQTTHSYRQDIKNTYPTASLTKRCSGVFSTAFNPSNCDSEKPFGLYKRKITKRFTAVKKVKTKKVSKRYIIRG
jgi:NAD-specific glutamate dehydrogenase